MSSAFRFGLDTGRIRSHSIPDMLKAYTPTQATAVIIANMIGTGVFTSLGFQLIDIQAGFPLMMLWILGGLAALCEAASYAELGAALPRSGGEYNFLGRIYHPIAGFISGWVSATIGFAAPVALAAITFGTYAVSALPGSPHPRLPQVLAVGIVLILTFVHSRSRATSGGLQSVFTALKIGVIIAFCLAAFILVKDPQPIRLLPKASDLSVMTSGSFAIALIYVSYAYTGWNAATYISGELASPQTELPRVLVIGTGIVMVLYVLLNYVFLRSAPIEAMSGKLEVGYIAAQHIFGDVGARLTGMMLALLLISTVSAMTLAGPRALQAIGEDFRALRFLGKTNDGGVPSRAIYFQSAIALIFIITSSFESILVFAGAMLAFNSFLTVLGVFYLRYKSPDLPRPYKTWGYPVTPLIYLGLTLFTLAYVIKERPQEAIFGLAVITAGAVFYAVTKALEGPKVP